jgi:hypothetical protein
MLTPSSSLLEVAVAVSEALENAGVIAPLSGGGAMSIYTENRYQTRDLDFVTSERGKVLRTILEPLGFESSPDGRHFTHSVSGWLVEFPPGPVAFGETIVRSADLPIIETRYGRLRVITPTQSLMDRLAAYFHWNKQRTLRDQARQLVASLDAQGRIDWDELYCWATREGISRSDLDEACARSPSAR